MREHKYKAWDKYNCRWLDLFQLAFAKDGAVMAINTLDGETYGLHQVDLVQYIEQKDKNGVEIYEGDIVFDGQYTWIVEWLGCAFWLTSGDLIRIGVDTKPVLVIGNIYENPELKEDR